MGKLALPVRSLPLPDNFPRPDFCVLAFLPFSFPPSCGTPADLYLRDIAGHVAPAQNA